MYELEHSGVKHKSGRYPCGSGEDPYQHCRQFIGEVQKLFNQGLNEKQIADGFGITVKQLRAYRSAARAEAKMEDYYDAVKLKEKGWSNQAIAEKLGLPNESSVRSLLDPVRKERLEATENVMNQLREQLDKGAYIDVGSGVENYLGVSATRLETAVEMLRNEGYNVYKFQIPQGASGNYQWVKGVFPPDVTWSEAYQNRDKLALSEVWFQDNGETAVTQQPINNIDSSRVFIRYGDQGGVERDGSIEIRPGVADLSLGDDTYHQVRIGVDGTHYLKGMAFYSDDIPDGYDIVYNTNKKTGTPAKSDDPLAKQVFKMQEEGERPFGAAVRQFNYVDEDGKEHLSAINSVNAEGKWEQWNKGLSSQFLSKQSPELAKRQLGIVYDSKEAEYNSIMEITNPVLRKNMLTEFASKCDSDAVHLEAAAMPRQATKVLMPVPELKDTECYCPQYKSGEEVVLIRYPHGGTFEIPRLIVNNENKAAKAKVKNAVDGIGINEKIAEQLSGADFDGDTVIVFPTKGQKITSRKESGLTNAQLKSLQDWDPKARYPMYDGMKIMTKRQKQTEMGKVSNLITDMTIRNADPDEIIRAVKHSMVVIDAEKHKLNWKKSFEDQGIEELYQKYQGKKTGGSSTIISRATGEAHPYKRKEISPDPETGAKRYLYTGETYVNKNGKVEKKRTSSTKGYEVEDLYELAKGTPTRMERVYADHGNKLKSLANQARKAALEVEAPKYSASAASVYATEVASLKAKLNNTKLNRPRERAANLIASKMVATRRKQNPDLSAADVKKMRVRETELARSRVGSISRKNRNIFITDREWEAIQSGAVHKTTMSEIFANSDKDRLRTLATPKTTKALSSSTVNRIKSLSANGYAQSEIAEFLGLSSSTINKYIKS